MLLPAEPVSYLLRPEHRPPRSAPSHEPVALTDLPTAAVATSSTANSTASTSSTSSTNSASGCSRSQEVQGSSDSAMAGQQDLGGGIGRTRFQQDSLLAG
jgi:hypothetical protein